MYVYFQDLPPTIGYLRKLRVLNADENFLESIPSEVCTKFFHILLFFHPCYKQPWPFSFCLFIFFIHPFSHPFHSYSLLDSCNIFFLILSASHSTHLYCFHLLSHIFFPFQFYSFTLSEFSFSSISILFIVHSHLISSIPFPTCFLVICYSPQPLLSLFILFSFLLPISVLISIFFIPYTMNV